MSKFEIGGVEFDAAPLKAIESLKGLSVLTEKVGPAIAAAAGATSETEIFAKIANAAAALPDVYALFVGRCKVNWQGHGFVPLENFADNVFARKPTLMLAWLAECLRLEYGDFLTESGQELLRATGSGLKSLIGFPGQSGG
jgi:hypothetical protein